MFKDKVLLITGGTGSFGNEVLKEFLNTDIKEIRVFSRDEKKQDDMRKKYNKPTTATFGQHPTKAIYFLRVASNSSSKLPLLSENTVLADSWSTKKDLEADLYRRENERILIESIKHSNEETSAIKNSKIYKISEKLRKILIIFKEIQKKI